MMNWRCVLQICLKVDRIFTEKWHLKNVIAMLDKLRVFISMLIQYNKVLIILSRQSISVNQLVSQLYCNSLNWNGQKSILSIVNRKDGPWFVVGRAMDFLLVVHSWAKFQPVFIE